eukprot:760020-Hanusia_phi.AAC.1
MYEVPKGDATDLGRTCAHATREACEEEEKHCEWKKVRRGEDEDEQVGDRAAASTAGEEGRSRRGGAGEPSVLWTDGASRECASIASQSSISSSPSNRPTGGRDMAELFTAPSYDWQTFRGRATCQQGILFLACRSLSGPSWSGRGRSWTRLAAGPARIAPPASPTPSFPPAPPATSRPSPPPSETPTARKTAGTTGSYRWAAPGS